jgi:flavin-dependent dehydrogenase
MSAHTVDLAIVGGGLAGCSAALALAQAGFSVALYEARAYPHDKVCGEFLSPEAAHFLDTLGVLPDILAHKPARIDHAQVIAPSGRRWGGAFAAPGLGLTRHALDETLANAARAAGVALYERAPVSDVSGSLDDGFTVHARTPDGPQTVRARAVIGAHGKRGSLDRTLARPSYRVTEPFVGLKAHFSGPLPASVDLYTFEGGYCGVSQVEGGRVNACLLVRQDVFRREAGQPADIERFVGWMARQNPALGDWLARSRRLSPEWLSISQVSFAAKTAFERDVLMAGDSAGLIAPLAGDGMSMALHAGLLASVWLGCYLRHELSADALRTGYSREWRSAFGSRLRLGRLLQRALLRPRLLEPGLALLNLVPALGDYFISHTRDTRTARPEGVLS